MPTNFSGVTWNTLVSDAARPSKSTTVATTERPCSPSHDLAVQGKLQLRPPLLVENGLAAFDQRALIFAAVTEGEVVISRHLIAGLGLINLPAHLAVLDLPSGVVGAGEADPDKGGIAARPG